MTKQLRISDDLPLPLDAVTQAIGLVGQRGSGKTYFLSVLAEELIGASAPAVILDPLGVLWGLRSSADGKGHGLPVIIVGGEHGDVPLEPTAGKVIADWVVTERRPCVLDVSGFRKAEQRRFVTDFALELYARNREPLHLIVDEADLFIPQRPRPDEAAMLGAFEDLVRRGRARGIGITIATQRPAVVHKDALTQVGVLVAYRLVGPQDRKAIEDWIRYHGTEADRGKVLDSLASLPVGTGWFWSPGWLGVLKKVRTRKRRTFDSSSTPALGAKRVAPQKLAPVDLEALKGRIADTLERAKADDPKALRAKVAELEKQIKARAPSPPAAKGERVEVPIPVFDEQPFGDLHREVSDALGAIQKAAQDGKQAVERLLVTYRNGRREAAKGARQELRNQPAPARAAPGPITPTRTVLKANASRLPAGELTVLTAVAQHRDGCSREQISILTGYKRSTRDAYVQRLSQAGLLEVSNVVRATSAGVSELGPDFVPLPTGAALREHWLERLPEGESLVLRILIDAYPDLVERGAIDAATCFKRSTRDAYIQRLQLRQLVATERGSVRARAELFD